MKFTQLLSYSATQLLSYSARLFLILIVISFLGCEEEQFEDSDRNPVSIIQSIETGNYNTFKRKPLFTESLNHVTNLITVDSSTIVEMRHNNYLSYTFLVKDDNGLDNRVTNMVVSYIDGNFINKALLDYSFVNQTESGSTDFSPNQLYSFPNGDCGYIVGVYVTPIGTGVDINWQYTLAPCSAGAIDSSNLDPGGVAAVLADLSPSNTGGSNPENSYGLPLHGAYTSYPITPGYSGYVGGYSDYYGSQPFGPTLYNPNNPPSEGGFYDDLINGNKNITTPIFLSASQRFVMNLSPELSQLYDDLTPTQQSRIEDFIENNSNGYEEYWVAKNFAEEVIEAHANGTLISDFPLFKYPNDSNYSTQYENLTAILSENIPEFSNNQNLLQTIHDLTGVSITDIKKDMQWSKGPEIHIEDLGFDNEGKQIKGKFNPSESDKVYIDIDLVNYFEQMSDIENPTLPQQQELAKLNSLMIFAVCLHELVHYEDFQFDGSMQDTPKKELGELFEALFVGGYWEFDPNNGEIVLIAP